MFRPFAVMIALALPGAALAEGPILVSDPYAVVVGAAAKSGAVYLTLENQGDAEDRLLSAQSEVADMVMLHSNAQDASGVMRMSAMEDGLALPPGESHALARGGDHIMLMGLKQPLSEGDRFTLILTFETAGDVPVEVLVDPKR